MDFGYLLLFCFSSFINTPMKSFAVRREHSDRPRRCKLFFVSAYARLLLGFGVRRFSRKASELILSRRTSFTASVPNRISPSIFWANFSFDWRVFWAMGKFLRQSRDISGAWPAEGFFGSNAKLIY